MAKKLVIHTKPGNNYEATLFKSSGDVDMKIGSTKNLKYLWGIAQNNNATIFPRSLRPSSYYGIKH
jgi:hypothetical protein